jgi:hypothetical protein
MAQRDRVHRNKVQRREEREKRKGKERAKRRDTAGREHL